MSCSPCRNAGKPGYEDVGDEQPSVAAAPMPTWEDSFANNVSRSSDESTGIQSSPGMEIVTDGKDKSGSGIPIRINAFRKPETDKKKTTWRTLVFLMISASILVGAIVGIAVATVVKKEQPHESVNSAVPDQEQDNSSTPVDDDDNGTSIFSTGHPATPPAPTNTPITVVRTTSPPIRLPTVHPTTIPTMQPTQRETTMPTITKWPTIAPFDLTLILSPSATHPPTMMPAATGNMWYPSYYSPVNISKFYAIGDVPYNDQQHAELIIQISTLAEDVDFLVHVGDLRAAPVNGTCHAEEYTDVAKTLSMSPVPVFVLFGDNDWIDCRNRDAGYRMWIDTFQGFERKHWDNDFGVTRLYNYPETFSFVHHGILYIGLNLVGDRPKTTPDINEWATRLTAQTTWVQRLIRGHMGTTVIFGHCNPTKYHDKFFKPLRKFIALELQNSIPIMYINGDKHEWMYESEFLDLPSLSRITVTGGTTEPPLKVTVTATPADELAQTFVYDRMLDTRYSYQG